jgi:hypothetical protein
MQSQSNTNAPHVTAPAFRRSQNLYSRGVASIPRRASNVVARAERKMPNIEWPLDDHTCRSPTMRPQEAPMVSIDHFRLELLTQMAEAATRGQMDILINPQELCRSIRTGSAWSSSCCNAMEAEMKQGDTLVVGRADRAGMTIRYLLPRTRMPTTGGLTTAQM